MNRHPVWLGLTLVALCSTGSLAQDADRGPGALNALTKALELPHAVMSGKAQSFTFEVSVEAPLGPEGKTYRATLARRGAHAFSVSADASPLGPLALVRTETATAVIDRGRKRVFIGTGALPTTDALEPGDFARRLARSHGELGMFAEMLQAAPDARALALQLTGLMGLVERPTDDATVKLQSNEPVAGRAFTLTLVPEESRISSLAWTSAKGGGRVLYALKPEARLEPIPDEGYETVRVDRAELERTLFRGLARAVEIRYRRDQPQVLRDRAREQGGGRLVVRQGQRTSFLRGTPRKIGTQHGKLLARGIRRNVDAVLYTFCLGESLKRGSWMLDEFRRAHAALAPHVPAEYTEELVAMAEAAGVSVEEAELANVVPELFHCSGFALGGEATVGGTLYHGRVLDYMSDLGLQDNAALFVVRKDGAQPFVSVGYAGFVGVVTGMNAERIAAGQMGEGGEGQWDGVPMALLMRMAMEKAATLDEAVGLLRVSKRTCHYGYVLSDGETGDACAVHALPGKFTLLVPGMKTAEYPEAVKDCVLISGGDRFKALIEAVRGGFGKFDEQSAKKLMTVPVAARGSNLHNVLFVPRDGVLFVANARGRKDAFEQTYYRYDLAELLKEAAPSAEPQAP